MNSPVVPLNALDETTRRQNLASDPSASAWVSANAGSGKTHVLTQRVIRLMLAGSRPSSILCLTYTKAAASEMSNRAFSRLSRWTSLSDEELSIEIAAMEGVQPHAIKLAEARRLFARALETPGGLKIQTIHAFCELLLHQFPLEANVAGHFSVLDDKASAALLSEARRALLTATQSDDSPALAAAFHDVLSVADETGLENLLKEIVARRSAIQRFLAHARPMGTETMLRRAFGLTATETAASIAASAWPLPGLDDDRLQAYVALANGKGGKYPQERAYALSLARSETEPLARFVALKEALLKKGDESPYSDTYVFSTGMKSADPGLCAAMAAARDFIHDRWQRFKIARMLEMTQAALTLAERLISGYEALKRERGFLDFEDFITRTEALLRKTNIGPWVHYKLDQGIDHLLLDEAQDTSPMQWDIIMSLTEDFFSGASARKVNRTIFTVGDEKQSIYSFQGARPERFAEERRRAILRTQGADAPLRDISLQVSFRSTDDILSAVDQVFSDTGNARGLSAIGEPVVHVSSRIGHAGTVDIWDIIADESGDDDDEDWLAPFDRLPEKSSASLLARRMAGVIRGMIGQTVIEERSGSRLMTAGDVLVLVRKRDAFAGALARELKTNGAVPVAGTDRLVLSSHIAVQDLMALARFALLPEDDLSLAALIKSPLINMGEDDLDDVCGLRGEAQTVWSRLTDLAGKDDTWKKVHRNLARWMHMANTMRVHDFFAHLLGREGGRRSFLARFGHEVSDVLDELLNFALAHEESGLPGLASFIATLENDSPEIKREQDKGRDEVRIMTVHASKGLEAPVVFLVDGGSRGFDKSLLPKLRLLPQGSGAPDVPCWLPGKAFQNAISSADDLRLGELSEAEYRRLFYVGMTRASDHLVLCGYRKKRPVPGTWSELAVNALGLDSQRCVAATFRAADMEWNGLQWRHNPAIPPMPEAAPTETARETGRLPESLFVPAQIPPSLPRPLAPSGAHTIIDGEDGDRIVSSRLFSEGQPSTGGEIKGRIIHRLLQTLPDMPVEARPAAAVRYLARAMPEWSDAARQSVAASVLDILGNPTFASLFSPGSRAEVSIMGTVKLGTREFAVSGRVDRMGSDANQVFILDYKTNRIAPATIDDVPFAHKAQLALYREVLSPIFPGKTVVCQLIYTEGPHLFSLDEAELEKALLAISHG